MKGKLLRGYSQDLQRSILAGTELEILESWCGVGGFFYRCQLSDGSQVVLSDKDIVITDRTPPVDWNQIRIQVATAAMQGFLANPSFYGDVTGAEKVADMSVQFADALIERLKNGDVNKEDIWKAAEMTSRTADALIGKIMEGGNNGNDKGRGGRVAPADEGEQSVPEREQSDAKRDSF